MQQDQVAANESAPHSVSTIALSLRGYWLRISLCLVVGLIVRATCLVCKPFWFDECFSVEVSRVSWRNFFHLLWWREANMSLYYLLLRVWLHFGHSLFFIRFFSVLIAVATIPAIFWLADLLYGRRVSVIAAALFTLNAYSVRYSQEARSYTLFLLLATLSSGCLIAWLAQPTRRHRIGYVVFSILAAYAHFYALLLVAAHWLALRWSQPRTLQEKDLRELRRMWGIIGIGVLPLLVFVAKTGAGPIKWIQRPGVGDLLAFYEHLAGGSSWILLLIYVFACVAALTPVGKNLWSRADAWKVWRAQFLVIWLLFPVLLTVLLSFARPVFLARYMIFTLPAFLILVSAGITRLRNNWMLAAMLVPIMLLAAQGVSYVYAHDFDAERDASGEATDFILGHAEPGDGIIFHIAETRVPYEFFRSLKLGQNTAGPDFSGTLGPEILFPYHGPGLDYRDFTGKPTADLVRQVAPNHPRIWLVMMNNGRAGKPDPTTQMLSTTLPEFFPKVTIWEFTKVEVRLYSKQ